MVDILAVGTHPDDVELGVGGAVAAAARQGLRVAVADLTLGEPTPHGDPETRKKEAEKAAAILGLSERVNLGLPNRWLMDTVEGRIKIAEVYRTLRPKILLLPHWEDVHPDHVQGSRMAQSARFIAKYTKTDMAGDPYYPPRVFYYFGTHLKKQPPVSFIIDISATVDAKMDSVRAYHSQFFAGGRERGEDSMARFLAHAAHYGALIGAKYGEPFFAHEEIGLSSFGPFLA